MNASEVVYTPVRQLAELVRERKVSPTTLAEVFLERLERIGPRYNAVVTLMPDRAMEEARARRAGDCVRHVPRPPARHPLRSQGPLRGSRRSDLVGRDAVQRPGLRS